MPVLRHPARVSQLKVGSRAKRIPLNPSRITLLGPGANLDL